MRPNPYYLFLFLLVVACTNSSSTRVEENLIGKWEIVQVFDAGKDVTTVHNPQQNRWIRFNNDGRFNSGGDPYGDNEGRYEIDNDKSMLFIYSSDENDDSDWHLQIEDAEMTWTGIGSPWKEGFKLIFKRGL
jgi:lipocalin-like protein